MTTGAAAGINLLINFLVSSPKVGILVPSPPHTLYPAVIERHGGIEVFYHLDESRNAGAEVESAIQEALVDGIEVKALAIINPGNSSGSVLTIDQQHDLVRICEKHNLVLLADEVYQDNIHHPELHPFTSCKKVVSDLQSPIPLVSFHSISKGVHGEGGRRGGCFETFNVPEETLILFLNLASA